MKTKTVYMPKRLFTRFLKALRSGEYQQGRGYLLRNGPDWALYCCLGVLEHVASGKVQDAPLPSGRFLHRHRIAFVSQQHVRYTNPLLSRNKTAGALNDEGVSFKRIAALFEKAYGGPISKLPKALKLTPDQEKKL